METARQNDTLELIASENHVSRAVLTAMGSVFTNKYAEGYPGKRYYGGCGPTDIVENIAIDRAKKLFGAEHANVQPHAGSQANMAVYFTVLKPGDTIMGMDLSHGGHLTHGHPLSYSGRDFNVVAYHVRKEDELIDYDEMERMAMERVKKLFGCDHANVQPHSGAQANMAVYITVCKPGDTILGMNLSHGGHLTHGHPLNFSGRMYNVVAY
ncbi:MAG TPA: hypothetical protein VI670_08430, partial [Thermoanaerobaculia bacterium]